MADNIFLRLWLLGLLIACSAILTLLPGGPYGSYELVVSARDGRAFYFSYGSSVDNATGDSWSVIGRSF